MNYVIAKVVENNNGYQFPSGGKYDRQNVKRKKKDPEVNVPYSTIMGFGHEEWNFNKDLAIGGKIYGYHYYQPSKVKQDDLFTIYFVTYKNNVWSLVGVYRNARFVAVDVEFGDYKKKALRSLAERVLALGSNNELGKKWANKDQNQLMRLLVEGRHWVVNEEDANVATTPIVIEKTLRISPKFRRNYHETRPTTISESDALELDELLFGSKQPIPGQSPLKRKESKLLDETPFVRFTREQWAKVIPRHKKLANDFGEWLKSVGASSIVKEWEYVDVQCDYEKKHLLFELKTCCYGQTARRAIRDAIGQIFDYSYFPGRQQPSFSAIVLDTKPSGNEVTWCKHILKTGFLFELFWLKDTNVYSAGISNHPLSSKAIKGGAKSG